MPGAGIMDVLDNRMNSMTISNMAVNAENAITSFKENCQAMSASGITRKMTWSHMKNERARDPAWFSPMGMPR
jgi:hypothetical protein